MQKFLLIPLFICLVSRSGLALPASVGDIVLNDCQLLKIDSAGAHLRSAKGAELLIPLDRIPEGLKTQFPNEYRAAINGGNEQQGQASKNVVIKGLYLGMKMEDAERVLSDLVAGGQGFSPVTSGPYKGELEKFRVTCTNNQPPISSAILSFDSEKKLFKVYFGGGVLGHIFKLGGLGTDEILRSFQTAYGLEKFQRKNLGRDEVFSSVTATGVEVRMFLGSYAPWNFGMEYQNKGSFN